MVSEQGSLLKASPPKEEDVGCHNGCHQKDDEDICEQSEKRMVELINAKITPTSSNPRDKIPLVDENGVPIPGVSREGEQSSGESRRTEFGHIYNNASNVQIPHVNNLGNPPLVDRSRFTNWKASMKSYVCSSSMEVWRIIDKGYYPKDEKNLSSSDLIDQQLDANAQHMLERAMVNEGVEHIRSLPNAKAAWDHLLDMYDGNVAIKRAKRITIKRHVDNFILKDGESPEDVHRRLKVLMVDMKDCGFKDCDDDRSEERRVGKECRL